MNIKQTKKAVKSAPKKQTLDLLKCEFAMVAITPKEEVLQLDIDQNILKLTAVITNAQVMENIGSVKSTKNAPVKKTAKKIN